MFRLFLVTLLALSCLPASASDESGEIVLADDGRQVRLRADGGWEFVSEDRYATREDGRRVRLKADGQWELVDDAADWVALPASALLTSRDSLTLDSLKVDLNRFVIESARESRHKNTRVQSQMLFTIDVVSNQAVVFDLEPGRFTVTDSRGRGYEVTQVSPSRLTLQEGENASFTVVVEGSPRWWGIKFLELSLAPGALGNSAPLTLSKARDEAQVAEVEQLTTLPR